MSKKRSKWTSINQSNPFLILLIIHICILAFTFYKKREKSYFVLLLSNIGFAYLFEYIVLNLYNGYRYKPKILKNRQKDNILGAVFSQALYVPILATTITAFRLGWKWKLLLSFCYFLIEHLFIYLKKFQRNWWKTYYTFFFLFTFFTTSDIWHRLLVKNEHPIVKGITSFLAVNLCNINVFLLLSISNHLKMGIGKFSTWKEHFIIVPIYSSFLSAISLISYKIKWKYSNLIGGILLLIMDFVMFTFNLSKNKRIVYILLPVHFFVFYFSQKLIKIIYEVSSSEINNVIGNI